MSTAASPAVARGPVPRDLSRAPGLGEGQALALLTARTAAASTVARGAVPRDLSRAPGPGEGQALALLTERTAHP